MALRLGLLNPEPTERCASRPEVRSAPPKVLEPVGRHFGVSDRVLNVLVPEVVLQGARVVAIVGQLNPAGMAKRTAECHPRAACHDGQSAMRGSTGGDGSYQIPLIRTRGPIGAVRWT